VNDSINFGAFSDFEEITSRYAKTTRDKIEEDLFCEQGKKMLVGHKYSNSKINCHFVPSHLLIKQLFK
jgi:hypothetical protein